MKRITDDFSDWRLQQENMSKPFPYIFPQMPRRFRYCCMFTKTVFLLEWICLILFIVSASIEAILFLFYSQEITFLSILMLIFLLIFVVSRFIRRTTKFFWHCPCCGFSFPYNTPSRYSDVLREKVSMDAIEDCQIEYVKPKFCPLIVPTVCPNCKSKFFDIGEARKN